MTRLKLFLGLSLVIAGCAGGAVVSDAGTASDTGAVMDVAVGDAIGDSPDIGAFDSAVDGTDGGLCPKERPLNGAPCAPPGLHCESKCLGPTPEDQFWTADCSRAFGFWSVNDHPCAPEFG